MTDAAVGGLESAAEPQGPERITFPCFDGFRALAAIVVLVTHVAFLSGFNGRSRLGAFTARMDVGVAIFFMISGFLLYRPFVAARLSDSPGPRAVAYFWRRGLRILPAYWVALTITVFLLHVPKELPSVGDLFLFYGLFHLYSLGNVIGPILSSYTLVTEISFYVFLPLYALAISRLWLSGRREPTVFRRRIFPALSWTLAAAAFVAISLLMGRPGRIDTLAQDMGVHYFYLAVGLFFLLPGIFGPQRVGLIRHVLENRVVQLLGLISYGLYLWNETLLEKYIEWTDSTPFNTSFLRMLAVVFVATVVVAAASYLVVEKPALSLKGRVPSRRPAPTPAA